jgi:hypothetical protein
MFAAEDCALDAVDALIEATFVALEGPAEVRLFRFSARACLDDAWAVANLGNLGCDDPYGGGGRRYVFGGGGAICAVQGMKRVIQRRFNVSVPRARVSETASTLRERSER